MTNNDPVLLKELQTKIKTGEISFATIGFDLFLIKRLDGT